MAAQSKGVGVTVDGLQQSINALGKLDKAYRKEAIAILRREATDVQKRSQNLLGRVGRYPVKKGMIGRSATAQGAGITLQAGKYPWAYGAEFGEVVAHVYGNKVSQTRFRRRTFGKWKPPTSTDLSKNRGGYMIQPTIRARIPFTTKRILKDMNTMTDRIFRQTGVPRG